MINLRRLVGSAALLAVVGFAGVLGAGVADRSLVTSAFACTSASSTIYFQGWDPSVQSQPSSGDGDAADGLAISIDVDSYVNVYCSAHTNWYLFISNTNGAPTTSEEKMSVSGQWAYVRKISSSTTGTGGSFNPNLVAAWTFTDLAHDVGSASDGTHYFASAFTNCTGAPASGWYGGSGTTPFSDFLNSGGGTCGSIISGDTHSILVDTKLPTTTASSPAFSASRTVAVSYTLVDASPSSGFNNRGWVKLWYRLSGSSTWINCASDLTNPALSGSLSCLTTSDGTWEWIVTASDDATNGSSSVAAQDTTVVDTVAPVSSVTDASVPTYSTSRTISIPYTASDATSHLANIKIYYSSSSTVGSGETLCATNTVGVGIASYSGSQSCTVPSDGTWYLRTVATDQAGNVEGNGASYDSSIVVDSIDPVAPSIADTALASTYRSGNSIYFRPAAAGTTTLTATAGTDPAPSSGIAYNTFGALSISTGWTYASGTATNGTGKSLTWSSSSTSTTTVGITTTDNAGNVGPATTITFIPDSTAPSVSFSNPSGAAFASSPSFTVGFSSTDGGSGIASWTVQRQIASLASGSCGAFGNDPLGSLVSGTASGAQTSGQTLASGCYKWVLTATDKVGNTATTTSAIITADFTDPTTTAALAGTSGSNGWYTSSSVTTTLTASDGANGTGITGTVYAIDGGATTTYTTPFAVTGNGTHTVTYHSTDAAGNVESTKTTTVKIDTVKPVSSASVSSGTAGSNGYYTTNVGISISASDSTSGVASTSYEIDGGSTVIYSGAFTISTDGTHVITYRSTDAAGNVETNKSFTVKVDKTAPTAAFINPSSNSVWGQTTYPNLEFTVSDSGGSGLASWTLQRQSATATTPAVCTGLTFTNDGSAQSSPSSPASQSGLTSGDCYRWILVATDGGGKTASTTSNTLYVDTNLPAAPTVTTPNTASVYTSGSDIFFNPSGGGSLTLTATVSPNPLGGVAQVDFGALTATTGWSPTGSSTDTTSAYTADYTWTGSAVTTTLDVTDTSGIGLTSGPTTVNLVSDNVAPTANFINPPAGYSTQLGTSLSVSWTATDLASGGVPGSGVASSSLQRQVGAIVTPGNCSGVTFADDGAASSGGSPNNQTGLTDACYRWVLTVTDHVGNISASIISGTVLVDTTPPPDPTVTGIGTDTYQVGETIWFNSSTSGIVDLTAATIDPGSGVDHHDFGAPSSTGGWSPSGAVTAPGNPSTSEYNWSSGASDTTILVKAVDAAGNESVSGTLITLRGDAAGPTIDWTTPDEGGTYIVGTAGYPGYQVLNWTVTDTESGIPADGSSQSVQRQTGAIVSVGTCAGVSWVDDGPPTIGNSPTDSSGLVSGNCYRWILTAGDNVGNESTGTSGSILFDTSGPSGVLQAVGADGGTTTTRSQDVTVTCSCSDSESGIYLIRYAVDGGYDWDSSGWISWPAGAVHGVTLNSGSGTYTIMAQIKDYAGNVTTISTTITLQNSVEPPTLTAAALIVDCDDPDNQARWQLNTTGVIYWPVNRPICLVPTVVQPDGGQGVDNRDPLVPKYGNLTDWWSVTPPPPLTNPWLVSYKLASNTNDPARSAVVWPDSSVGVVVDWDPDAPEVLRFLITKETAALTTSLPYIGVSYQLDATETWCTELQGAGTCDAPEHINPELNLRIIALNSGQIPKP